GSVLKAHQAQDGHQLRLCESVLGELAAVSRQHLLHHLHGRASKQYETNFSHRDHLERYRAAVKLRMSTEPCRRPIIGDKFDSNLDSNPDSRQHKKR
ncbi:MAG TPA: hypothetical protein VNN73_23155, partial [Blastocatellia bacterium]|nr:hypothetical protein [Blastocatellia bacterium]